MNKESKESELIEIKELLIIVNTKIDMLQKEVSEIKNKLIDVDTNCKKMDSHINFVENTYDTLKYPISIFKNKIEQVFGRQQMLE